MATEVQTPPQDTGIGSLIKGIVNDFRDLIKQQFQFARTELKSDLKKTGDASRLLAMGVGMAVLGTVVLVLMLVHLLHWLTIPAGENPDPAALPLWACYGIVGGLIMAIGVVMIFKGKEKFDSFNPLPDQTLQTMKENLEWTTNTNSK
jgi:hypothetical protein